MTKEGQKFGLKMGNFSDCILKNNHRKTIRVENRKFFGKYLNKRSSVIWRTRKCYLQKSPGIMSLWNTSLEVALEKFALIMAIMIVGQISAGDYGEIGRA